MCRFLVLQERMSKMEVIMEPIANKIDILLTRYCNLIVFVKCKSCAIQKLKLKEKVHVKGRFPQSYIHLGLLGGY